ncbi:MAG: methyltransferase domain-containing protein [Segetibacter sp.]
MEMYKPYRECPVCNSKEVRFLHSVQFVLFDNHPMSGGYNVVQCEKCLFIYADTHVTQQELDIYYKELSKYEDKNIGTGGGYSKNDKDRLVKTAEYISSYLPDKNARIIDLGCANGGLLKELKNLGFNNLVGLDPSSACVEITKNEVGCEAYQMSLFNIDESLGKFDLVILSHVLEHLLDLSSTINKLNSLLKEGSLLYVECPNASNYNKVIHAPLQEFNTEHINHFTEVSFENLFGLHSYQKICTGDKIMKIASDQDYHAVYGMFKKTAGISNYTIKPDKKVNDNILSYIYKSEKIFNNILDKFFGLDPSEPIALYGIGQFAFKLLSRLGLKNYNQIKLFDNNNLNIGKKIQGVEILPGKTIISEYEKAPFTIVITSLIYEHGIRKQIEEEFRNNSLNSPSIIGFQNCLTAEYAF